MNVLKSQYYYTYIAKDVCSHARLVVSKAVRFRNDFHPLSLKKYSTTTSFQNLTELKSQVFNDKMTYQKNVKNSLSLIFFENKDDHGFNLF